MENKQSQQFLRKRKFMMVMPLLTLPFLTLAFWAMGGGKGNAQKITQTDAGLNLQLPDAKFADESQQDKLSFYDKAQEDSLKLKQQMLNDPFYKNRLDTMQLPEFNPLAVQTPATNKLNHSPFHSSGVTDANEAKIYEKLNTLNKALQQPSEGETKRRNGLTDYPQTDEQTNLTSDVDRLENMMQVMSKTENEDPEMQQLNGTLDKILDIQHPQRVKERIKEKSQKQKENVFAVTKNPATQNISLLEAAKKKNSSGIGFYGIDDNVAEEGNNTAIEAVAHANQVLVNGAVIKLRLATGIYINGTLIPKDNFVFGIASLNDERLQVEINSIRNDKSIFPVKLEVYDMDGLPGIYIPGAITRDVAKQSADNSLQLMELSSMDPSLKAQAAATGITAAKTLLSKKIKQVKVTVKAGYKVLLKDKNLQQ